MSHRNGVGVIVDEVWKKNVVEVYRSGDKLLSIKMIIEEETINVNREWWTIKKQQEHKMDVREMKMLRVISGV